MKCLGWEGSCERTDAERFRQNTQYVDEERNFTVLCPECRALNEAYWRDMWADYYGNCL